MQKLKKVISENKLFFIIIIAGVFIRFYFRIGHVFSDDAYYSYLSHSLLNGEFIDNYLGYPVFPLRIGQMALNSFAFVLFGTNEFATVFFPFLFSVFNLILTYKLAFLIIKNKTTALFAVYLMALFPTDIIFATINFPDLSNMFFINTGIYFLLKSYYQKNNKTAYLGGIFLFLSMQFKENVFYLLIILVVLLIYHILKLRRNNFQILIGIIFIGTNFLLEGFIYFLLHNDFFYRLIVTSQNYQYSFYDFFPYTAQRISGSKDYITNLLNQIVFINAKSVFLRRFYLFLPVIAFVQSIIHFRKRENGLLIFWFTGLVLLLIAFTTSFTEYKPLDLKRSWYIYPVIMPMIILSAQFISGFKKQISILLLIIYTLGSLIMCHHYEIYFDKSNLNSLKNFLRTNPDKIIITDHFTKYSVDLIREYSVESNSRRILSKDFDLGNIKKGEWILYNEKHIDELKMQKFTFPDFSILKTNKYRRISSFKDFIFYERIVQ